MHVTSESTIILVFSLAMALPQIRVFDVPSLDQPALSGEAEFIATRHPATSCQAGTLSGSRPRHPRGKVCSSETRQPDLFLHAPL